jgi:hypothetical protein
MERARPARGDGDGDGDGDGARFGKSTLRTTLKT